SFVSLEAYYRVNTNKITEVKSVQDNGIVVHTYQNLNKDFSLGSELMGNIEFSKMLNVNASINVFDYKLEGTVEDEDVNKHSTNWNGKLNITMKFKYDMRAQISGIYQGKSVTAQGTQEGFPMLNVALRKDFFNKKLSATLSVRDLLMTAKRESTSEGSDFYSYDKFKRESPVLTLDISYIINNYKKQPRNGHTEEGGREMDMEF
ncbi:MAG: outer membrane beta-barrel family protein, partial [Ignavibacteria bacterium]|nr:outer membrane beta-barrel family protein [Ignavibacteria bacterium]